MADIRNIPYDEVKVGDTASLSREITSEDIHDFARVSRDVNPVHIDEEYAAKTMFGQRIAHGFLAGSLISAVIGTQLPGENSIYMGQNMKFLAPVLIGDTITATVEVVNKRDDKHMVTLKTTVTNQKGKEVITGEAVVLKK